MSDDGSIYFLVMPEPAVNPEVTQVIVPTHEQPEVVAQFPQPLPGEAVRHPITAEVAPPVLDQLFEQGPATPQMNENTTDLPPRVKPSGDLENLAALSLVLSGGWVVIDHLEEMNKPHDEEGDEEKEEPNPEPEPKT
jgi:hypothetical protein